MFKFQAIVRHQNSRPIQSIDFRNDLAGSLTAIVVEVSAGLATSAMYPVECAIRKLGRWFKRTTTNVIDALTESGYTPGQIIAPFVSAFAPMSSAPPMPSETKAHRSTYDHRLWPTIDRTFEAYDITSDDPSPVSDHSVSGGTDEPIEMWEQYLDPTFPIPDGWGSVDTSIPNHEQEADRIELGDTFDDEWERYVAEHEEADAARLASVREDREPIVMPSASQVTAPTSPIKRDGLDKMTKPALLKLAKEEECVGYSKLAKPELIECIRARRYEIATTD